MTNTVVIQAPASDTDANFRLWGKAYSDALTAAGIPKSADTGQIDWATVSKPGSTQTAAGYEIRYLNDSLHSTYPVYFKIEYGSGSGSASQPSLWFTTGTGTNGSGTITGYGASRTQLILVSSLDANFYVGFVSGSGATLGSGFSLCGPAKSPGTTAYLSIERTRDSSGAITADGHAVIYAGGTSNGPRQWHCSRDAAAIQDTSVSGMLPREATSTAGSSIAYALSFGPIIGWTQRGVYYTKQSIICPTNVGAIGTEFIVPRFGSNVTYKNTGNYYFSARAAGTNVDARSSVGLRWE